MASTILLPVLVLSCLLTIKPSKPIALNDGGHGHAAVIEVQRKRAKRIRLSRNI